MEKEKTLGISIPMPCIESWDKMTPKENGKHCDSCNKLVVDFTTMPTQDVLLYFVNNKSQKICGHFYQDQIGVKYNSFHHYLLNSYCKADKLKNRSFKFITMALISFVLTITGCSNHNSSLERLTGDSISTVHNDTNLVTTGKIKVEEPLTKDTIKQEKKTCNNNNKIK